MADPAAPASVLAWTAGETSAVRHHKVPSWRLHGSGCTAELCDRRPRRFRQRVAIDLGTVNTLIAVFGRGVIVDEPSAVAFDRDGRVVAVGRDAEALAGREFGGIEFVHPLRDGVVTDLEAAAAMLAGFLGRVSKARSLARADIAVCIPAGATSVERRGLLATLEREARPSRGPVVVEEPLAAALGAFGTELGTRIVVDVGGGTTEVGAVTMCGKMLGTVRTRSIRTAGNAMDAAIVDAVRSSVGLSISSRTAERLKIALGAGERIDHITGMAAGERTIRTRPITRDLLVDALCGPQQRIVEAVTEVLSALPPDVSDPVGNEGVWLTGGGARLAGLRELVAGATGLDVRVAGDPLRCVVRGLGIVLGEDMEARAEAA